MSQVKKKTRPLGLIRGKLHPEKLTPIPSLKVEQLKNGVQGSAIIIPTPLPEQGKGSNHQTKEESPNSDNHSSGISRSPKITEDISHEKCEQEIKEGLKREKDLKDQLKQLQRQLNEAKRALTMKEEESRMLHLQLTEQEKEMSSRLAQEKSLHESTQYKLKETQEDLEQTQEQHGIIIEKQREEMNQQIMKLESLLSEKDAIIADRDQKLVKLKAHMAEALKGNSWERQQQLEELTKEMLRIQEECDILRMKVKTLNKTKQVIKSH
ncbi:unnamed protein product [Lymnaea stagnalis]|uniref:Uncharacterized protein n=1 Tax=Lymnaea stagnalis TaxID=6523 RepID=A0AAV2H8A3_LYMST